MIEILAELLPVVAYGTAAVLLTGLGILTEKGGLAHLANGDSVAGLWMVGMGMVFLYLGVVLLGYGEFRQRVAAYTRSD